MKRTDAQGVFKIRLKKDIKIKCELVDPYICKEMMLMQCPYLTGLRCMSGSTALTDPMKVPTAVSSFTLNI